ncbi:MAG: peptidylprolyl isomerase [Myxococcales bacterium]|nr:peptidylprolyl isomerase [Myxococcales bacterium]
MRSSILARPRVLVCLALLLAGCDGGAEKPAPKEPEKQATPEPVKQTAEANVKPTASGLTLVEPKDPNEACASVVYVAWKGAEDAPDDVTRDQAAAKQRAEELQARVAAGEPLAAIASAESDHAKTKAKEGGFGTFTRDKWPEAYPKIAEAVFALKVNETSPVVETARGFAIVQRCAVDKAHTRHILIRYAGADRADDDIKRSKDEAKQLAEKILADIQGGKDFAKQAEQHGEDGTAERGGDLGPIGRGMFVLDYERAAWAMTPGDVAVVESPMGFHVVKREG